MADDKKIYPEMPVKTYRVDKVGYNSITQVKETDEYWEFELYNPNVKPESPADRPKKGEE